MAKKRRMFSIRVQSKSDIVFYVFDFLILLFFALIILYPLIYIVSCSFSSPQAVVTQKVFLFPVEFNINAYTTIFENTLLVSGFGNSIIYAVGSTIVHITILLLAAYPMSRKDLPGRKIFLTFFLITMFFSGGTIPNYLLLRNLYMTGTRWAMIIPFLFSCYNMLVVKTYFSVSLPDGLLDAAHIDGCSDIRYFVQMAIPLAKPVIAVMVLYNVVGSWNGYYSAFLYLSKPETYPLQLVLRDILFVSQMTDEELRKMDPRQVESIENLREQIKYSVMVVGALPMMLMYPFVQKYFAKGVMLGAVKE